MKSKKLISILLVFSLLCGFACCFAGAADTPKSIGKAYISFVDNAPRIESNVTYPEPLGTIYAQSEVDIFAGDTVDTVTKRFVEDVKGATMGYKETQYGSYFASIDNVTTDSGVTYSSIGEFDAGSMSGWMVRYNNRFMPVSADQVAVDKGDVIAWMYTCQYGADIGNDYSETSAAITGLTFSAGKLSPAFSTSVKEYTLTLEKNVTSIKVDAELKDYGTEATYMLVHRDSQTKYKYNRDIPVAEGDKIIVSTKKVTDRYDANYNYIDTVTDTDSVTITIAQEKGGIVETIRAFIQMIIDFIKNIFSNVTNKAA